MQFMAKNLLSWVSESTDDSIIIYIILVHYTFKSNYFYSLWLEHQLSSFKYNHDCRPEMFHFPKFLSVPFMSLNLLPNSEEKIRFKKYIGLHHFNS